MGGGRREEALTKLMGEVMRGCSAVGDVILKHGNEVLAGGWGRVDLGSCVAAWEARRQY